MALKLPSRQRQRPVERRKRTTGGAIRKLVEQQLRAAYGASWADDLARHLDSGGDFYPIIVVT
jgi:hypothetical protein